MRIARGGAAPGNGTLVQRSKDLRKEIFFKFSLEKRMLFPSLCVDSGRTL